MRWAFNFLWYVPWYLQGKKKQFSFCSVMHFCIYIIRILFILLFNILCFPSCGWKQN